MKTSLIYSPMLLLLLGGSLLLLACERTDPQAEADGAGHTLQAELGPPTEGGGPGGPSGGSPCGLDEVTSVYDVSATYVEPLINYDFAVELKKMSNCQAFVANAPCDIHHGQVNLSFLDQEGTVNDVVINDFEAIVAHSLAGPGSKVVWQGIDERSLTVEGESIIYFRWRDDRYRDTPPAIETLSAGGLCIIGIMTEPCPHCPPGSRPLRPLNLLRGGPH